MLVGKTMSGKTRCWQILADALNALSRAQNIKKAEDKNVELDKIYPPIKTEIINPKSMDSTTKHLWRWIEFFIYHLGALAAIMATFTLPFAPGIMTYPVRIVFAVFIGLAIPVGLIKLIRRFSNPHLFSCFLIFSFTVVR